MQRILCNKDWFFSEDKLGGTGNEPRNWEKVDLPHDYIIGKKRSADAPGGASNGYFASGAGTYIKHLDVDPAWKDGTVLLDIDGAYMNAEVSMNRELLAMHPHGYTPYQVDLTRALRFDGSVNRLKIRTQSIQPSTRWYCGGGIYRDVCLLVGGKTYINPWDLFVYTEGAGRDRALVTVRLNVTNHDVKKKVVLSIKLIDADGRIVRENVSNVRLKDRTKWEMTFAIVDPRLWDLDHPYLYRCQVELMKDGKLLDRTEDTFGIRTIKVDAESGLKLNGRPLKLRGGCLHHDNGFLGACAYEKAEARKIGILKKAGYNAVRIAHNPPSKRLLEICDRLGILVLDEAFDMWREQQQTLDYHMFFEAWWKRDIKYMVKRDRNHPCVIAYSIGNEIPERDDHSDGGKWSKRLVKRIHEFDKTRLVTSALCGIQEEAKESGGETSIDVPLTDGNANWFDRTDKYCYPLDVVGYNYMKDFYEESDHMYPYRVVIATETHSFYTYEYWEAMNKYPFVIGDFIWAAVDYLGEVGAGRVHWGYKGGHVDMLQAYPWRSSWQSDIDLTGEQRPQSVYREIMWGNTGRSAIYTTHPVHNGDSFGGTGWHWYDVNDSWTFDEKYRGVPVKVDVYGAGDEAEFILNGRSLGKAGFDKLIATMDIPYEPGTLQAIVYRDGAAISRCALASAGPAYRLVLTAEDTKITADGYDLAYIRAVLQDEKGNRLTDDESEISAKVGGAGTFVSMGSANPCTEDAITARVCHLFRGTAIIIVKGMNKGKIEISADAGSGITGSCVVEAV